MATVPDDDRRRVAAARIAEVRVRFLAGLPERLKMLADLARLTAGENTEEAAAARDSLRLGLHNLSGGAPSLGLGELGRRAAEIETCVIEGRKPDGSLAAALASRVGEDVVALIEHAPPN